MATELVDVHVHWRKNEIDRFTTSADPTDARDLERIFRTAVKRDPKSADRDPDEYEITLFHHNAGRITSYVGGA